MVNLSPMSSFAKKFALFSVVLCAAGCSDPGRINPPAQKHKALVEDTVIKKNIPEHGPVSTDTAGIIKQEPISDDQLNKASVSMKDSTIWLTAHMRLDHRIFGYEEPDSNSRKMILLSIFTNDVSGNPYKCPYGSYYETNEMDGFKLKFVSDGDIFIRANVEWEGQLKGTVYIDKKWIEFAE